MQFHFRSKPRLPTALILTAALIATATIASAGQMHPARHHRSISAVCAARRAPQPVVIGRLAVVTASRAPVYGGREKGGRLLIKVPSGTSVAVTGQSKIYYQVLMADRTAGYIYKTQVNLLDYVVTSSGSYAAPGASGYGNSGGWKGQALVQSAVQCLGIPYLYGGTSASGIDCSAFVRAVYAAHGISLPRTAQQQANVGYEVPLRDVSRWQVGDRMYFLCHHNYIDHCGMYIGNGYFVHSHIGGGVSVTRIDSTYYWQHLVAVRRSQEMLAQG